MLSRNALQRVLTPILVTLTVAAQSNAPKPPESPKAAAGTGAGKENLEYDIEWRLWTAGHAKLDWVPSPTVKSGWQAKLHLESMGVVSRLFRVSDDYTAETNSNYCAVSTYMTAREGSRSRDTKVTYDGNAKKAFYEEKDLQTNAVIRKDSDISACVHDIIGGLHVLRLMNLEPGRTGTIPVSNGKKLVNLKVESQRREEIKVPAGTMKTIRYEVFAFDNQLYNRSGHLHIWLTDDNRRIPAQIQIRLQFAIGTITLRLTKETQS